MSDSGDASKTTVHFHMLGGDKIAASMPGTNKQQIQFELGGAMEAGGGHAVTSDRGDHIIVNMSNVAYVIVSPRPGRMITG